MKADEAIKLSRVLHVEKPEVLLYLQADDEIVSARAKGRKNESRVNDE
jgi:thymidylate kinase